jgi:putative transposase
MAGKSVSFAEQSAALVECKQVRPDLANVYSQTLQDVLHRVDRAFKAFFDRLKRADKGHKPGFPRFRSYDRFNSFTYPQLGWSLQNNRLTLRRKSHSINGTLKLKLHRPVCGKVKTVQVKREGTRWFVCFTVESQIEVSGIRWVQGAAGVTGVAGVQAHTGPAISSAVGIDVGLEHLVNMSNGEQVDNPRYYRKGHKRLAKAQRQLARAAGTHPKRREYRKRVATCHRKVRNQRADFLHKLSRRLVQTYSLIAVEKLNVKGLASVVCLPNL